MSLQPLFALNVQKLSANGRKKAATAQEHGQGKRSQTTPSVSSSTGHGTRERGTKTAAQNTLELPDILDEVFNHLSCRQLLLKQRVCRLWKARTDGVLALREKDSFADCAAQIDEGLLNEFKINVFVLLLCDRLERGIWAGVQRFDGPHASWRRMQLCSPPRSSVKVVVTYQLHTDQHARQMDATCDCRAVCYAPPIIFRCDLSEGVTVGQFWDKWKRAMPCHQDRGIAMSDMLVEGLEGREQVYLLLEHDLEKWCEVCRKVHCARQTCKTCWHPDN